MKAITYTRYGSPEMVLKLQEVEKPTPGENEVLVRIKAAAINDYDWSMVRGRPFMYRLLFGMTKPKHLIPGMELSGIVEAAGPGANRFQVGEEVYGDISEFGFGALAEFVAVNEKALVTKPSSISFEEAASISHASMLAHQGLFEKGNLKKGQKILINGAGGGVGTFGLQLAKLQDAEVTGVDTGDKLETMKVLGFDQIIDYRKSDFTKDGHQYDLILDCKTNRSPYQYVRCLKPGGSYVTVGGELNKLLQLLIFRPLISKLNGKNMHIVALKANKGLEEINQLLVDGKMKCQVDGPYKLEEVPTLIQYFGEGKHHGKVVVSV